MRYTEINNLEKAKKLEADYLKQISREGIYMNKEIIKKITIQLFNDYKQNTVEDSSRLPEYGILEEDFEQFANDLAEILGRDAEIKDNPSNL